MSYRFVKGIKDKIQGCCGDIIITESNSGNMYNLCHTIVLEHKILFFLNVPITGYEIAHIACLLGFRGKVIVFDSVEDGSLLAKARIAALGILSQ